MIAGGLLIGAGYLFGVKIGEDARSKLRNKIENLSNKALDLQSEIERALQPLRESTKDNQRFQAEMQAILEPMASKERLGDRLNAIRTTAKGGRGLGAILDAMVEEAGFLSAIVSDDGGLPLAANKSCLEAEELAGASALMFVITDRLSKHKSQSPIAITVHDERGHITVHRIFEVVNERYLFSVSSDDTRLTPKDIEPALSKIIRVMSPNNVEISA
ncbi:hypothetical protein KKB55_16220 [Myxococcota bacterium]|nr:hypothetical protein [Myxococcota bacterium]